MDVERELRDWFEEEARRAVVPGDLDAAVLRRSRIRRRVTAAVAAVGAAAMLLAGVVTVRELLPVRATGPVGPGPVEEDATPRAPEDRVVLAHGTEAGVDWELVAYQRGGDLCVDFETSRGETGACGYSVGEVLGVGVGYLDGLERTILHGPVSKEVSTLEVRPAGETPVSVQILEGPEGFEFDFYVAFVPIGSSGELVALAADGSVLAEHHFDADVPDQEEALTEEVLDDVKLTVYYPDGWSRASEALVPDLVSPSEVLSVGTGSLIVGGDDCATVPEQAIEAMGPADALVSLQEETSAEGFPDRPADFSAEEGSESEFALCLDNRESLFFRAYRFKESGRGFYAYVAIGSEAPPERRKEAFEILNNLVVCKPDSPPEDCL